MLKEFKEFALRGNVLDLAVAVIIGGAFGKIVSSLVNDVLMPVVGLALGGLNFSELAWGTVKYGLFVQAIVDFVIIAFVIFLIIKAANATQKPQVAPEPAAPTTKACPRCLSEIKLEATRCPHCTSEIG
jgi:large conductance mechanosensitive channel